MVQRATPLELQVRRAFEPVRAAPHCLVVAYEQVAPIPRRRLRPSAKRSLFDAPVDGAPPRCRRIERG
jgi:hypothetical protein